MGGPRKIEFLREYHEGFESSLVHHLIPINRFFQ
jgi:hypothetical protein